jgi:hypothetical protein
MVHAETGKPAQIDSDRQQARGGKSAGSEIRMPLMHRFRLMVANWQEIGRKLAENE